MDMEAFFDNKGNVLDARIRISRDNSAIYTVKTTFGLRGRKITVLQDENPPMGKPAAIGHILWKEKVFEIHGQRKPIADIRRTESVGFLKKTHFWRWSPERKEFEVKYHGDGWKATLDKNISIAARFLVPSRPHLFSKTDPPMLHLTKTALEEDEVFLIMVLIYSEAKRQDKTNSSSSNGGVGW
ncbi:hypothetical protein Hypma_012177 [Hypsizygus marmoreus]|uniref:Uncharacterized protein n=1 Tax=Hypsizygus marmoreus TaxID=39966 RepID=A0A369JJ51_HYPMA|nr:hypothetical protein Hypma_012177 [Hypsizygus marmoreus]